MTARARVRIGRGAIMEGKRRSERNARRKQAAALQTSAAGVRRVSLAVCSRSPPSALGQTEHVQAAFQVLLYTVSSSSV